MKLSVFKEDTMELLAKKDEEMAQKEAKLEQTIKEIQETKEKVT